MAVQNTQAINDPYMEKRVSHIITDSPYPLRNRIEKNYKYAGNNGNS